MEEYKAPEIIPIKVGEILEIHNNHTLPVKVSTAVVFEEDGRYIVDVFGGKITISAL